MSKKALKFLEKDNVVVALENLTAGDTLLINGIESDLGADTPISTWTSLIDELLA